MNKIRTTPIKTQKTDVLIIGSGAAGLSSALKLGGKLNITVVAKSPEKFNSTWFAQGGIASVNQKGDSFESHIEDTLICGSYLNDKKVVKTIIAEAPNVLNWLVEIGMKFSRYKDDFHLHQEGGHQFRRIFHVEDATGRALQEVLIQNVKKAKNIQLINHQFLLELMREKDQLIGAKFLNQQDQSIEIIYAKKVILASGGACNIYLYSSSPTPATGDGLVCAYRLGARVANLEFTQFHPTCFYNENARHLLLTEALRGEGAVLRLKNGSRFMAHYHKNAELAPRDIVARAIDTELKKSGEDCVYLDITHRDSKKIRGHFPTIYKILKKYGFDLTKDQIPIVPAAHYFCGGVMTDLDGKTDIEGLYAIGEVAHTGLHGANRLASNSLLECLVMGHRSAHHILKTIDFSQIHSKNQALSLENQDYQPTGTAEKVIIKHLWDQVRQLVSNYVGIMRTTSRLKLALTTIEKIESEALDLNHHFQLEQDYYELLNLICVSKLTIKCALIRKESRGLHYNQDYPNLADIPVNSILKISD